MEHKFYYKDGSISGHFILNKQLHRTDGPAVEFANGNKAWYQNDKLHRIDGPAIEYANGKRAWYVDGKNYSEKEFNNLAETKYDLRGTSV